jgi:hypothetical protein
VKRNPLSFKSRTWFWTKCAVWSVCWGVPLGALSLLLSVTIVGLPIGISLLLLAAAPLSKMVSERGKEVHAWRKCPTPGLTTKDVASIVMEDEMTDAPWDEH